MRKVWIALAATIAAVAVLVLPGAAMAGQTCRGVLIAAEAEAAGEPQDVKYAFTCAEPFKNFTIVTSDQVIGYGTEPDVVGLTGAVLPGILVSNCEGFLPSSGFSCAVRDFRVGALVSGTFSTLDGACARDRRTGRLSLRAWIVADGISGRLGVYKFKPLKDCAPATRTQRRV